MKVFSFLKVCFFMTLMACIILRCDIPCIGVKKRIVKDIEDILLRSKSCDEIEVIDYEAVYFAWVIDSASISAHKSSRYSDYVFIKNRLDTTHYMITSINFPSREAFIEILPLVYQIERSGNWPHFIEYYSKNEIGAVLIDYQKGHWSKSYRYKNKSGSWTIVEIEKDFTK